VVQVVLAVTAKWPQRNPLPVVLVVTAVLVARVPLVRAAWVVPAALVYLVKPVAMAVKAVTDQLVVAMVAPVVMAPRVQLVQLVVTAVPVVTVVRVVLPALLVLQAARQD
jgi:hypothetical protein